MKTNGSITEIDLDNPEFQNLWKLINYTDNSVFLTGKAGTGKSTFLKYITAHTRKKFVVLAPTGIAAVNVGGVTMHSFFNIPFKPLLPDDPEFQISRLRKRLKYNKEKQKLIKNLELVIIDEISMVRADIIDFIDKVLRVYGGNMREPFGGKQLLLVGDIFQLEPVVTADMRDILRQVYPNAMFFSAKAFDAMAIVSIELRKVYRQNDSDFISMLDRIRLGAAGEADIARLNSRVANIFNDNSSKMTMTLAARRDTVDHINEKCLNDIMRPLRVYTGELKGEFPESSLPTALELQLKEGAQVVFIKNDREGRWVNGTLGKVSKALPDMLEVELENGDRHVLEPEVWNNVKYSYDEKSRKIIEKTIGSFVQFPLRLAWALTIHKSQGLTFNNVEIDMGHGAFSSGQTYVALSRCRSLDGLTLRSTIAPRDIFINPAIVSFSRSFNDPALINTALSRAHADDCYRRAAEAFDSGETEQALTLFIDAMRHRSELHNDSSMRLVRRKLGLIRRQREQIAELRQEADAFRKRLEKLAGEYVYMGRECLAEGYDPTPALANFEKALSLSPASVEALIGKGEALKFMNDPVAAIEVWTQAMALASDKHAVGRRLALAYVEAHKPVEAAEIALQVVHAHPKSAEAYDIAAGIFERIDEPMQAGEMRQKALKCKRKKR